MGAMEDGTIMIVIGGVELWLPFEDAAALLDMLSDTLADAFEAAHMNARRILRESDQRYN